MQHLPTIQKVSPSCVANALVTQSYGTFIVRYPTSNDELIFSIHISNRSASLSPRRRYVILSVRVDETLCQCLVMNYHLSLIGQNDQEYTAHLLEQYNSQRSKLARFTPLIHELILPIEELTWILNPKQFQGIHFVKGQFTGKNNDGVSKSIWQRSKQHDIKIFIKKLSKDSPYVKNELDILNKLCFFPIITLYGQYSDKTNHYLVFAHGGQSLESVSPLRAPSTRSKMFRIVNIGYQIANAMIYLEKKNIVHRDLTAGNILIDDYGYVRIADFGHAIQKEEGKNNLSRSVTANGEEGFQVRFLAPECLLNPSELTTNEPTDEMRKEFYASFSSKSDVWSFGIVLVQLMLAKPSLPYPHILDDKEIPTRIAINHETHPQPPKCDIDLYYVLQRCWAYKPINRISFTELREKMHLLTSIFSG
jgi:serine/threonine protein kinase